MTLQQSPEHGIVSLDQQPAVTHIHFRTEAGMERFIRDNIRAIKSRFLNWNVDYERVLTVTAAR